MTQPTSNLQRARWELSGPAFLSREDTRFGQGRLGCDYTTNVDGRYSDGIRLGPKINTVNLTAGGTAANTNGFVRCRSLYASAEIAMVTRGTDPDFVRLSDFAVATDPALSFASRALSPLYTKAADGSQMISVCLASATYRNITALAGTWPTVTPTESACNEAITNQVLFEGWPENVIFGGGGQVIRSNTISGATTMDASAWATRATVTGEGFTFTGGGAMGSFIVFGTTNGPYIFDSEDLSYHPAIDEIGQESTNCAGMKWSTTLGGFVVPTALGTWLISEGGAKTIGPERYVGNLSPIMGRTTAFAPLEPPWLLFAFLNPVTTDTHLCYARPAVSDDPFEFPLVYYPVATLTGIDVEMAVDIGKAEGQRTNPAVVFGYDDDLGYITRGRLTREVDDSNYLYAESGTWYGTTMLRTPPGYKARVVELVLTTDDCTASYYVQAAISMDGGTTYQNIGATTTTNGQFRFQPPSDTNWEGVTIKPRLTLTGTSGGTSSPVVQGFLDIVYTLVEDKYGLGN